jgi:hypothetical protein
VKFYQIELRGLTLEATYGMKDISLLLRPAVSEIDDPKVLSVRTPCVFITRKAPASAANDDYYYVPKESLIAPQSVLRRATAEVKQCLSVMRWVTKNLLSRGPSCFGKHMKPLIPAAFTVVSTLQSALGPRGGL